MKIYNDDYSKFAEPTQTIIDKHYSLFIYTKEIANKYNRPVLFSPGEGHYVIYPERLA